MPELSPNSTLSHYRIISKIGAGGMGEVYVAQDTKLDRLVALKILPPEFAADADRMRRFVLEAKTASALNHPNIITIYEIGEIDGTNFIATEYIDGKTLNKCDSLSLLNVLDVASQIASALQAAHRAGIVHRDIKPDNVMVRPDGLVKILDFGVAKLSEVAVIGRSPRTTDPEAATVPLANTSTGMIIGTATYMSPEQARGKTIDARSDIFSFGVVLYEMLSGVRPFSGENAMDVLGSIVADEPKPLRELRPSLPVELEQIVKKSLQKDRETRYQTAGEVLSALKSLLRRIEFEKAEASPVNGDEVRTVMLASSTQGVNSDTDEPSLARDSAPTNLATQMQSPVVASPHNLVAANHATDLTNSRRRTIGVVAIFLAFIAIAMVTWLFLKTPSHDQIQSIAVMPFVNASGNSDVEYLSDGLTDSLIFRFSQLPKVKVSPTSSVMRFKGTVRDVADIARELNVDAVLSGRLMQVGDNLSISVQLVDARTQKLVWAEQYDRKLADLLATQREIATTLTEKMQLRLAGDERAIAKKYTSSNDAYQLYLKGRYHWARRTKEDLFKAIENYKKAIELDSNFALAYAAQAEAYNSLGKNPDLAPKDCIPLAKAAATRALEIDPSLPEAHSALGDSLAIYDWNWSESEREFKRALELDPKIAYTHVAYGLAYLTAVGKADEVSAELEQAVQLEPLSLINNAVLVGAYLYDRKYDKALIQARNAYDLDPNFPLARHWLGSALVVNGKYEEARSVLQQVKPDAPYGWMSVVVLAHAYAKEGKKSEAEQQITLLRELGKTRYVRPYYLASIYASLGDKDKAFAELERSFTERDCYLGRISVDPFMDPLREDPRFKNLLKRINLS
jgi:eukaryotic-like serine/threonine-protein kinase